MIIISDNSPNDFLEYELTITKIDINPDIIILTCINPYDLECTIKIERDDFITILKRFSDQLHL